MDNKSIIQSYYESVDQSDLDHLNKYNQFRILVRDYGAKMIEQTDTLGLKLISLEDDLHNITKSIENGLSPGLKSVHTNAEGKEIEIFTPNYPAYTDVEFDYFQTRYTQTNNLYLKVEYGLLLFLSKRLQHIDERQKLVGHLISYASKCKELTFQNSESNRLYAIGMYTRIADAIALCDKSGSRLKQEFEDAARLLQSWYLALSVEHKEFPHFSRFLIKLFTGYFKKLESIIAQEKIFGHIDAGIEHWTNVDSNPASVILEEAKAFNIKCKFHSEDKYHLLLGTLYEKLGDAHVQSAQVPEGVKDYEKALLNFNAAKNKEKYSIVARKFEVNKGNIQFAPIGAEVDATELFEKLDALIELGDVATLLSLITGHKLYRSAKSLRASAVNKAKETTLVNLVSHSQMDKYGNTIRIYESLEEKEQHYLTQAIDLNHRMTLQYVYHILKRTLEKKIITYEHIEKLLFDSWYNEPMELYQEGALMKIGLLPAIMPGVRNFFMEFQKSSDADYTLCTDSLTIRIEMILRHLCKRLGEPTFKHRGSEDNLITEEKLLFDLLEIAKEHISDEDYLLIRYLTNEKGGLNIRNNVAHGLVDAHEYGVGTPLTLFMLILRLSLYKFEVNTKE